MRQLLFFVALAATTTVSALLPPVWQDVAELKAILNDSRLNQLLDSGESLQGIEKQPTGWLIRTDKSIVFATVHPEKQTMPGPEKFSIEFTKR
jgi:hypothetical protein